MEKKDNNLYPPILAFLGRFLLSNFFWIFPCMWFIENKNINIVFYSFLVSFFIVSYMRHRNGKSIVLVGVSYVISLLYYLSVIIFLILTGVATYEGIRNVFGLVGGQLAFAVVFAIGIPLTLFTITLFLKERRSPVIMLGGLLLYMMFDAMTALPFNFLFFYENVKSAQTVENDRINIAQVINLCDSVIRPKLSAAEQTSSVIVLKQSVLNQENQARLSSYVDRRRSALKQSYADGLLNERQRDDGLRQLGNYVPKYMGLSATDQKALSKAKADSTKYATMLFKLDGCRSQKFKLDRTMHTKEAQMLIAPLKQDLLSICNASDDSLLKLRSTVLTPKPLTSLEAIKSLYGYLWRGVSGDPVKSNAVGREASEQKENDMLITMSLASSLVIDILPLFLSLLYARFKRED